MPIVHESRNLPNKAVTPTFSETGYFGGPLTVRYTGATQQFGTGSQALISYRSRVPGSKNSRVQSRAEADEHEHDAMSGKDMRDRLRSDYVGSSDHDHGHEFSSQKFVKSYSRLDCVLSRAYPFPGYSSNHLVYKGYLLPTDLSGMSEWPPLDLPSSTDIDVDGSKGMRMALPTAPEAGLAQFLAELREDLPKVVGLEAFRAFRHLPSFFRKSVAGEALNLQFGIIPSVGDIRSLAQSVLKANKIVAQFQRDSGKTIRRRRTVREDRSYVDHGVVQGFPAMATYGSNPNTIGEFYDPYSGAVLRISDVYTERIWFSGAFSYHLDQASSYLGEMTRYSQQADRLLGTDLSIDLIWELTPWSWLLDWWTNLGGFFANVDAFAKDNLVLKYGYVMHQIGAVRERTIAGMVPVENGTGPGSTSTWSEVISKTRTRATPYGFGLNPADWSPQRWAILGALGLSGGTGNLRRND